MRRVHFGAHQSTLPSILVVLKPLKFWLNLARTFLLLMVMVKVLWTGPSWMKLCSIKWENSPPLMYRPLMRFGLTHCGDLFVNSPKDCSKLSEGECIQDFVSWAMVLYFYNSSTRLALVSNSKSPT